MAFTASNWGRGVLLTGLSPSASLSGYVALVDLANIPAEAIDGGVNSALNGGGDLRFSTDIDGVNQLPLEVVSFVTNATPGSRRCQLWIRFPTYASGAREVYMYYNKAGETQPAVGAAFGRNAVFADEIARMHMESVTPIDSTGNQNSIIANAVSVVVGNIGNALDFNGTSSYVDLGAAVLPVGDFTMSAWVNPDALSGFQGIISNWVSGDVGRTYVGTSAAMVNWDGYATGGNTRGTLANGVWNRVTVTRTGSTVVVYVDEVQQGATITDAGTPNADHNTFIGALSQGLSNFFNGQIGDTLLSNSHSTADKISSEQDNQNDPSTFWTTGTPFTPAGAPVTANGDIALPSLVFAGSATDSTSEVTANGDIALPSLVFAGSATDSTSEVTANGDIALPSLVFAGSATDSTSEVTANGGITLPSLVFSGSAGELPPIEFDHTIVIDVSIKTIQTTRNNFTLRI